MSRLTVHLLCLFNALVVYICCLFMQVQSPFEVLFLVSCLLIVLAIPGRAACVSDYEDTLFTLAVVLAWPYYMFFHRSCHFMMLTQCTGRVFLILPPLKVAIVTNLQILPNRFCCIFVEFHLHLSIFNSHQ